MGAEYTDYIIITVLYTDHHKGQRMGAALTFLEAYDRHGDSLLDRIVTGDETWVRHVNCIRHVKTVVCRPQANRTERVNRDLVQMIANYVNDQHDTWDQFLREFAYAIRTAVNKTTEKTPSELFLSRKLITPFQKLVMVLDGTEFSVRDIGRLFDEARRNTKAKHEKWEKYYNRCRHDVQIKMNDWVLIKTHPLSLATKKVVAKFKPKFESPLIIKEKGT
ncbi:uncharacterized protein TNCV_5042241 [Trichonephila clavipes]|nr:uncharacterized protein TNCV_5042241 [Trichonephila clavipes]